METSTHETAPRHIPWNKGKLIGQKHPLKLKDIWAIRIRLQVANNARELALFNLAIDSKLRGCDLVQLKVCDVAQGGRIASRMAAANKWQQWPTRTHLSRCIVRRQFGRNLAWLS